MALARLDPFARSTGKHYFIEHTNLGFAVRTQHDAIGRANEFNPDDSASAG